MKTEREAIIERFHQVKMLGFVRSNRSNNTGIGKTFEDYIGVVENNLDEPDLYGYEIKSHREDAGSYITLFTKSPDFPKQANKYLRDTFGTPYDENPDLNKLHTSMFASKYNSYNERLSFRLINDRLAKTLRIGVYDYVTKNLIDSSVGYSYDSLQKILQRKLHRLFYVSAQRKRNADGVEEFYFDRADIFTEPSLENFLNMIDEGLIMYDIRIGSYSSGIKYGLPHDHGSGFRVLEGNLHLLYANKEIVE